MSHMLALGIQGVVKISPTVHFCLTYTALKNLCQLLNCIQSHHKREMQFFSVASEIIISVFLHTALKTANYVFVSH